MRKPKCDICKGIFASWESVYNHKRTQHDDIVEYVVCPFWPDCRNNKHLNGLYQTMSNLRVHLHKHHDRVKGAECIDLIIEKVYWRRKRRSNFFPLGFFHCLYYSQYFSAYNIHNFDADEEFSDDDNIPLGVLAAPAALAGNIKSDKSISMNFIHSTIYLIDLIEHRY